MEEESSNACVDGGVSLSTATSTATSTAVILDDAPPEDGESTCIEPQLAVICVCLVSMLEDSMQFQVMTCREYCIRNGLTVASLMQIHGRASPETMDWRMWKDAATETPPMHIVFYRLRHISVSARILYDAIDTPNISLHFVQDCLIYTQRCGNPSFKLASLSMDGALRSKLRDLITLMHMCTCSAGVLREFIVDNFSTFGNLIHVLKTNVVLVTIELNRFRLRETSNLHRTRRFNRSRMTTPMHFREFLGYVQRLRAASDNSIGDICGAMACVSLGAAAGDP